MPEKSHEKEYDHDLSARSIVENCFRNGKLEDYHTGIYPRSATGDYSDVKVVTPFGEIPWDKLSRINDDEMRELMIDAVNKTYTFLTFPEQLSIIRDANRWNKAEFDASMMYVVEKTTR